MAKQGFKVLDSDMHVVEPADLWKRYIDPAYRDLAVRVGGHIFPAENRSDANAITPIMTQQMSVYQESEAQNWDSASQLAAMDQEGIDLAVLFPTRGLLTLGTGDLEPGLATAISRAYNDWLADFCAGGKGRMFGAGMLLPHDVEGHSHGDYMPGFALFERTYQPPRTRI
jgi:predicted TIM-barrel fold metal-dependent hydrolase